MPHLDTALAKTLQAPHLFSAHILSRPLRPFQRAALEAAVDSITHRRGDILTLMFARQMGKNETSAHLETYLLTRYQRRPETIIKAAPTYHPQTINSKIRLMTILNNPLTRPLWWSRDGYQVGIGEARCLFVSGSPLAQVVGLTASLLLEIDEAQDFDKEKYSKDFRPMASSTNATTILYGTAWTSDTILAQQITLNKALEEQDGRQRNFIYPWQVLAESSANYRQFVEAERDRIGHSHPIFRTQYELQTIDSAATLFDAVQITLMHGTHASQPEPHPRATYVAGLDLAGEDEQSTEELLSEAKPKRDSAVLTIGIVTPREVAPGITEPAIALVRHYAWLGVKHRTIYAELVELLNHWGIARLAVDATGVGAGVASFLESALGEHVVEQVTFSHKTKSDVGFAMLAAVNARRLRMYGSTDQPHHAQAFWRQCQKATYQAHAGNQIAWGVDPAIDHDDYLVSLALTIHAANSTTPKTDTASVTPKPLYQDGRF